MLAAGYIAQEARAADLLITGSDQEESLSASPGHVTVGDLVMRAGRPVLVVPPGADTLDLERVVVGRTPGKRAVPSGMRCRSCRRLAM